MLDLQSTHIIMPTSRINKLIINTTYSLYYIIGFAFIMIG